jgi:hypothetical protein
MRGTRWVAVDDRGSMTVETALALASFVFVLTMALFGLNAAADQVRCVDAAREAARLVARGDPEKEAQEAAHRIAPPGARVAIAKDGDHIEVAVRVPADGLPGVELSAEAFAVSEPGT